MILKFLLIYTMDMLMRALLYILYIINLKILIKTTKYCIFIREGQVLKKIVEDQYVLNAGQ